MSGSYDSQKKRKSDRYKLLEGKANAQARRAVEELTDEERKRLLKLQGILVIFPL